MKTYLDLIQLGCGIEIRLIGMVQMPTYGSFLEGDIGALVNQIVLQSHADIATRIWPDFATTTLGLSDYAAEIHSPIPLVQCTACFIAACPATDSKKMASGLTIIWFQHEMSGPITDAVKLDIQKIEWRRLATDFDW